MSNSNFYQTGPGVTDTLNPTVLPNTYDGYATGNGSVSALSPNDLVTLLGRAPGTCVITLGGSAVNGDVIGVKVVNPSLPNGSVSVNATEVTSDSLTNAAERLAAAINDNSILQQFDIFATTLKGVITLSQLGPMSALTSVVNISTSTNTTLTFNNQNADTVTLSGSVASDKWTVLVGGSETDGDVLVLRFAVVGLAGGHQDISVTTSGSEGLPAIAAAFNTAINANTNLTGVGVTSTVSSATVTVASAGPVYMTALTNQSSGTPSETLTITHVARDILTLRFTNAGFSGGHEDVPYQVVNGDTLTTVAAGIAAAINADTVLDEAGITATSASAVVTVHQNGTDYATITNVSSGSPSETITIADPSGALAGGSGVAVPMNSFDVTINNTLIRLRYAIPVQLTYPQLLIAAAAGPLK